MHEEAVLRDLVREVDRVARAHGSDRVARVRLRVGALSHLTERALREGWPRASAGTAAASAALDIESSADIRDPAAESVRLVSVSLEETEPPRERPAAGS